MKAFKPVHDTVTFTLTEADLTAKKVGEKVVTSKRDVICSNGLQWWLLYYPAGRDKENEKYLSLSLHVNSAVLVKYGYRINGILIHREWTQDYPTSGGSKGYRNFASHDTLRQHFTNGQLSITCNVEFNIIVPFSFLTTRMVRFSDHVPTDFEIIVGLDRVHVHNTEKKNITLRNAAHYRV